MHFDNSVVAITVTEEPLHFAARSKIISGTNSRAEGIDNSNKAMVRWKRGCCFETW